MNDKILAIILKVDPNLFLLNKFSNFNYASLLGDKL